MKSEWSYHKLSLQATYPKQMIQQRMKIYKTCWLLEKGKELANWAHIKGDLSLFRHGLWLCTSCRDTFLDKNNDWSFEFIRIFTRESFLVAIHCRVRERTNICIWELCKRPNLNVQPHKCILTVAQMSLIKDYPNNYYEIFRLSTKYTYIYDVWKVWNGVRERFPEVFFSAKMVLCANKGFYSTLIIICIYSM